jgi:hypothetical protein
VGLNEQISIRRAIASKSRRSAVCARAGKASIATIKLNLPNAEDETVGKTIGRYKILEKVGEGGCGVVYVAEQTEPVRRRVALKVIKLGMDITIPAAHTKESVMLFRWALITPQHRRSKRRFNARRPWAVS